MEERRKFDEELKQELRDYIHLAVQSGKAETSGLVADILRKMDVQIEQSVQKHVNGKIIEIQKTLNVMNTKINPMYDIFSSVSGFDKIGMWILKFLALVGGALVGLYALIEFIKKIGK